MDCCENHALMTDPRSAPSEAYAQSWKWTEVQSCQCGRKLHLVCQSVHGIGSEPAFVVLGIV